MTNRKMQAAMRDRWVRSRYTSEPDDVELATVKIEKEKPEKKQKLVVAPPT